MALFRAIGSIARDAIVGSVISFFTFLIMMMLGGFLLKKDDIHKSVPLLVFLLLQDFVFGYVLIETPCISTHIQCMMHRLGLEEY